jgi:anti-anti-sigma factor
MAFNLQIEIVESTDSGLEVKLTGELDQLTVKDLRDQLNEKGAEKASLLVFNLEKLEFMASAGLSVFVFYHELFKANATGQEMKIVNCPQLVKRVFQLTKMDSILSVA